MKAEFSNLLVLNLPPSEDVKKFMMPTSFVIKTCMRILIVDFDFNYNIETNYTTCKGADAYNYLLRVICGLESFLLGESEIVKQFKDSYQLYSKNIARDSRMMKIIEKVFKDGKEIRTKHVHKIGGKSYSSLTKKIFQEFEKKKFLIIGSGNLAVDIVRLCSRDFDLHISSRNKAALLAEDFYNVQNVVPWENKQAWGDYDAIVNTVGTNKKLFDSLFFDRWRNTHCDNSLFIDLGVPSPVDTPYGTSEGVYRLTDIINFSEENTEANKRIAIKATEQIEEITIKREDYFNNKFAKHHKYNKES